MTPNLLYRASNQYEAQGDGRTIEGLAFKWNTPSRVTDDGGATYYLEAFAPGSADKTLKERAAVPLPLGNFHPWRTPEVDWDAPMPEPIGSVQFRASDEGLIFRSRINADAEQVRADLAAGKLGDVSVGYRDIKSADLNGIVMRTEIALYELSLAPVGTAQHADAKVLAMRALNRNAGVRDIEEWLLLNLKP